jgi:hypothetical protein
MSSPLSSRRAEITDSRVTFLRQVMLRSVLLFVTAVTGSGPGMMYHVSVLKPNQTIERVLRCEKNGGCY